MHKKRQTIPTHKMSDALTDKVMVWLVSSIKTCTIEKTKQTLIKTLLFIEKERVNHADKDNEQHKLDKLMAKYGD
uniref:Uncharacterized protein n=1 Tax=OCS116 cluster bacterium TaxID=2030921 RepID=A0A2A4YZR5_9PROT